MLGQRRRRWTNIKATLGQRLFVEWDLPPRKNENSISKNISMTRDGSTANTRLQGNVDLMLAHRLRLWANIKSTLVQHLVFAEIISLYLTKRWLSAEITLVHCMRRGLILTRHGSNT